MKALSQVETKTTVIVQLDTGAILEFAKTPEQTVHAIEVSNLSTDQYDLLDPQPIDAIVMGIIENNRNAFDSLFSNL
jgi:hypothetical protein